MWLSVQVTSVCLVGSAVANLPPGGEQRQQQRPVIATNTMKYLQLMSANAVLAGMLYASAAAKNET